jgi:hypothetical protein
LTLSRLHGVISQKSVLFIKQNVYKLNPYTIEELKGNIRREVYSVSEEQLQCVNVNLFFSFPEVPGIRVKQ